MPERWAAIDTPTGRRATQILSESGDLLFTCFGTFKGGEYIVDGSSKVISEGTLTEIENFLNQ